MVSCKICNLSLISSRAVAAHLRYNHTEISLKWYNDTYVKRRCTKCPAFLSVSCKGEHCNKCRDRTGAKNPFYGKKHKKSTVDAMKIKTTEASKKMWQDPAYREKVISAVSKPRVETFKQEQSVRIKQWYADNPVQKELRSAHMTKSWREEKIIPNFSSINESKGEIQLREECSTLLPNREVKKGTIHIGNKWYLPDIIIDDHYIIEYYGDYWHANPDRFNKDDIFKNKKSAEEIWAHDYKRISDLEDNGYKVMVIWQSEYLTDKPLVLSKIEKWCNT